MATIKSYTDIYQSKKLAEILPLESADYCWGLDAETSHYNSSPYPCAWKDYSCKKYYVPCWSLAALLDVLPRIDIEKEICSDDTFDYRVKAYIGDGYIGNWFDVPLDACYEMIIKLNELNLL